MNINEECLLLFLNNPGRLEFTTKELKNLVFTFENKAISNNNDKNKQKIKTA